MNRQFLRFIIVGFLSTFINYFFYVFIFKISSNILFSSSIGYASGIVNSYLLGKKWVFKSKRKSHFKNISKFLLVYFIGGIIMTIIIKFLYAYEFEYRIAWCFGMGYSIINNFLGSKFFVFEQ